MAIENVKVQYKVTADIDAGPLMKLFEADEKDKAEAFKQRWLDDPDVFNVALWKRTTTVTEEIL